MSHSYFLSDLHLKSEEESSSQKLLLFLHSIENKRLDCSHLFLVGDIFDLWVADHRYFLEKYKKIINAIRAVCESGVEVHYFEGNHDLYLENFWQQDVGVRVHDGPEFFQLGPHRVRVEHGDFMNPEDKAYLRLRWALRTPALKFIAQNLPGKMVSWLGENMSQASRHRNTEKKVISQECIKAFMHDYAENVVDEKGGYDYLITGHTHVRDIYELNRNGKQCFFINLGWWQEGAVALKLDDKGHRFIDIEDS